jgi:multiple sugar transport system substrate-binding protein
MAGPAAADAARLRMVWWGSGDRAKRTLAALDAFKAGHAGVEIDTENTGWDAYWAKLATQTAGGNAPDVIQMDYRYLFEYARRGALRPMDDLLSGTIDTSGFSPAALASGKVDGKTYGLSMGLNSTCILYDQALIQKLGLPEPNPKMTWAEFGDLGAKITKAVNKRGFFGLLDGSIYEPALEIWTKQHDQALYTEDGRVGFTKDTAFAWFSMWAELRAKGACATPDINSTDKLTIETNLVTTGHSAVTSTNSNQLVGFQAVNKSKLAMTIHPNSGKSGQYLKPSMMLSLSAKTADAKVGGSLVDFLLTKPEGTKILGLERGVPAPSQVRDALGPTLDELGKAQVDFISLLAPLASPLPPPPPKGAGEVEALIRRVAEKIAFGQMSTKDGADTLITEAEQALARNRA